jgi:hypothetical protein
MAQPTQVAPSPSGPGGPTGPGATPRGSATEPWGPFPTTGIQNRPDPDPLLTPGVTDPAVSQANIGTTICVSGYTSGVRPPVSYTNALKASQIAAYGYADTALGDYEEDHLISLELGGSPRDPLNLWPEPHSAALPDGTPAGSTVKDRLENDLHRAVCAGSLSLAQAQEEIATDWVGAWIAAGRP